MVVLKNDESPLPAIRQANDPTRRAADLGRATLQFDYQQHVHPQDQSWRSQKLLKPKSPRLFPTTGTLVNSREIAELVGKSDDEVLQALLDEKVSATSTAVTLSFA